jgi:hypothetical protein
MKVCDNCLSPGPPGDPPEPYRIVDPEGVVPGARTMGPPSAAELLDAAVALDLCRDCGKDLGERNWAALASRHRALEQPKVRKPRARKAAPGGNADALKGALDPPPMSTPTRVGDGPVADALGLT